MFIQLFQNMDRAQDRTAALRRRSKVEQRNGPKADILPLLQINWVTRVCRADVLAALTKPLACRLCRLWPPPL